jgi:hypothetical protein
VDGPGERDPVGGGGGGFYDTRTSIETHKTANDGYVRDRTGGTLSYEAAMKENFHADPPRNLAAGSAATAHK